MREWRGGAQCSGGRIRRTKDGNNARAGLGNAHINLM
jgi:hypothetical protein